LDSGARGGRTTRPITATTILSVSVQFFNQYSLSPHTEKCFLSEDCHVKDLSLSGMYFDFILYTSVKSKLFFNDEMYQLDATIVIYYVYHKYLYSFNGFISFLSLTAMV
jgi:hypothetical protein